MSASPSTPLSSDILSSRVRVEASATIANFGPGYDTFGLCIDQPSDLLEMEIVEKPGIRFTVAEEGFQVPSDPELNTASVAAMEMMRLADVSVNSVGMSIRLLKGVRPGSGLGSSASSAVAGAYAAAELLGIGDQRTVLRAAVQGEGVSSGAPHLDNVAPCLFGGFTVVLDQERLRVLRINPPRMKIVICLPEISVQTSEARQLIPSELHVKNTVAHVGWASGIVHGMNTGDLRLIASCMMDEISVPARKQLIRGYDLARSSAIAAGALSFSISGSGPAVFSIADDNHEEIGESMVEGFSRASVSASYFIASPGTGAKVVMME